MYKCLFGVWYCSCCCCNGSVGDFGVVGFWYWLYWGLRGIAPRQWLPQLSCFRWLCRFSLRFLLDNDREDVPDVPDVPELFVEHDASELFDRLDVNEIPANQRKRTETEIRWEINERTLAYHFSFSQLRISLSPLKWIIYLPDTLEDPELIEYRLADCATRTPALLLVLGACENKFQHEFNENKNKRMATTKEFNDVHLFLASKHYYINDFN